MLAATWKQSQTATNHPRGALGGSGGLRRTQNSQKLIFSKKSGKSQLFVKNFKKFSKILQLPGALSRSIGKILGKKKYEQKVRDLYFQNHYMIIGHRAS